MKPAPFTYLSPRTLEEATAMLRDEPNAKVIAGGQSLVPLMSLRLARPSVLVDINAIASMTSLKYDGHELSVGGLTRHADLENASIPGPLGSLIPRIAKNIGHAPIRTRGTFAGSLAHADPAAEWCVAARTLDARILVRGTDGEREISADDFFKTVFTTALDPTEIIYEIRLPLLDQDCGVGFAEFSRRAGDFALVMAICVVAIDGGRISDARLGIGGASQVPLRLREAEQILIGSSPTEGTIRKAATAAAAAVEPIEDIHASEAYRRSLTEVLTRRALTEAAGSR